MRAIAKNRLPRVDAKLRTAFGLHFVCVTLLLFANTLPILAVEHPGTIGGKECSSCHANKLIGKSVHSAMSTSCAVCHVTHTQGDMTIVSLSAPKERICFSCHEKAESLRLHRSAAKGLCVDCHDAHRSDREMLLRVAHAVPIQMKTR